MRSQSSPTCNMHAPGWTGHCAWYMGTLQRTCRAPSARVERRLRHTIGHKCGQKVVERLQRLRCRAFAFAIAVAAICGCAGAATRKDSAASVGVQVTQRREARGGARMRDACAVSFAEQRLRVSVVGGAVASAAPMSLLLLLVLRTAALSVAALPLACFMLVLLRRAKIATSAAMRRDSGVAAVTAASAPCAWRRNCHGSTRELVA